MTIRHLILSASALGASFFIATTAFAQEGSQDAAPRCDAVGPRDRPCGFPRLTLAVEAGVAMWNEGGPFGTATGLGANTSPGGSWGLRVGVELTRWLAFDAHYIGMANRAGDEISPAGKVLLYTNAGIAEVRLTWPLPYVQPYFFTGVGVYDTRISGSDQAVAGSPLYGSTELGIPIGLGLSVPISNVISLGAELTYHRFFGEQLSDDDEVGGGDLTTFNAVLRARF